MKTLLIIDGNSLIHRAYHALPPFTSPSGKPVGALYGICNILLKILREKKPDYIVAAFDRPEPTFRHHQYEEYKGTRSKAAEELISQIVEARNLFKNFGIKTFEMAGYEADDIIMTIAKKFANHDLKVVIYSGDLDLLQGVDDNLIALETPKKGISDNVYYNAAAVIERFGVRPDQMTDYKGLVGDTSDNIPGVVGVGPKTAREIIKKYGTLENLYEEIETLGLSNIKLQKKLEEAKEVALLSKRLAILKTDVPIEVGLEDLKVVGFNAEIAKKYFNDLGFTSLVARLDGR